MSGGGGAGLGGAIFNLGGTVNLVNSTITGNTTTAGQNGNGSTTARGLGGGLFNLNGSVNVVNSTFAANTADDGGSIYNLAHDMTAGVPGGGPAVADPAIPIAQDPSPGAAALFLANSVFVDAVTAVAEVVNDQFGNVDPGSASVVASASNIANGTFFITTNNATTDSSGLIVVSGPVVESTLAANGAAADRTRTLALVANSPARDVGRNAAALDPVTGAALTTDQRGTGFDRVSNTTVDLGAFELQVAVPVPTADVQVTNTDGRTTATSGDAISYTITVTNTGPDTATGVAFADDFLDSLGVTFTATRTGGATGFTAGGTGDIADTLTLPSGATVTYTATGTIPASFTGTLTNTALATVPRGTTDPNTANNTATDTTEVIAPLQPTADVQVTNTDGRTTATSGDAISVHDHGDEHRAGHGDRGGVRRRLPRFPGGHVHRHADRRGDRVHRRRVRGHRRHAHAAVRGDGHVHGDWHHPGRFTGTLTNTATATVSAVTTDPNPANNTATDTTEVAAPLPPPLPMVDVRITKTTGAATLTAGDPITYTITVTNAGPGTASAITVIDDFLDSLGITFTSTGTGGASGFTASGAGDLSDVLVIPAGATITYLASGIVPAGFTGRSSTSPTWFCRTASSSTRTWGTTRPPPARR